MFKYQKYLVKDTDNFNPDQFPNLEEALLSIEANISKLPAAYRTEMMISSVKTNSIKKEWTDANPELASLINSKTLPLNDLEDLFSSCSNNQMFTSDLEKYIEHRLKESTVTY